MLDVLVSVAALTLAPPDALAESEAPLVTAVERAGMDGAPLALLSLWIIANGALAQIVMASRVIYGLRLRRGSPASGSAAVTEGERRSSGCEVPPAGSRARRGPDPGASA